MSWKKSRISPNWLESEDGNYRIIRNGSRFCLLSFIHEDENGNPKRWDFPTLKDAQEYVDYI